MTPDEQLFDLASVTGSMMAGAKLHPHPLAEILPPMRPDEYSALLESIKLDGLLNAITLYENHILDGIHRHKACLELGVEPRFETYSGNDPLAFVIGQNLTRRMLDDKARGQIAVRLTTRGPGGVPKGTARGVTVPDAARLLNVKPSRVYTERAMKAHPAPPMPQRPMPPPARKPAQVASASAPAAKPAREGDHVPESEPAVVRAIFDFIESLYEREADIRELTRRDRADLIEEFAKLLSVEITIGRTTNAAKAA
jgi:hypothetical protein